MSLCTPGPPPTLPLGSPAPLPPWQRTTWKKILALIGATRAERGPQPPGERARAPRPRPGPRTPAGGVFALRAPARAPPPPGASQRSFVPPSPGTPVPEKLQEKKSERQKQPALQSEQGRWGRAKAAAAARGVPSETPRPREHRGLSEKSHKF